MFWNPFVQPQQISDVWMKAWKDQAQRWDALTKEVEKVEAQSFERANEAVDETTRLAKESISYAMKLNAEWRKVTLEAVKKTSEMFGVGA